MQGFLCYLSRLKHNIGLGPFVTVLLNVGRFVQSLFTAICDCFVCLLVVNFDWLLKLQRVCAPT